MPIFFLGSGLVLIITGLKGSPAQLWQLVEGDFSGSNNYVYWMVSILALGALGYIDQLKNVSRLFIILILLGLLLDKGNRGFFTQLQAFINGSSQASSTEAKQ